MVLIKCYQGHDIPEGEELCNEGHATEQPAPVVPVVMPMTQAQIEFEMLISKSWFAL